MRMLLFWMLMTLGVLAGAQESFNTTPPPITSSFSCSGLPMGYYADAESNCRAYHTCDDHGNHFTHYCPEDTAFRQDAMICDHAYLVDCQSSIRSAIAKSKLNQDNNHDAPPLSFVDTRSEGTDAQGFSRSFRINQKDTSGSKYPTFVLNSSVFLKNREPFTGKKTTTRSQESESESFRTSVTQDFNDNSSPFFQSQEDSSSFNFKTTPVFGHQETTPRNIQNSNPFLQHLETTPRNDVNSAHVFQPHNNAAENNSNSFQQHDSNSFQQHNSNSFQQHNPNSFFGFQNNVPRNEVESAPAFQPQHTVSQNAQESNPFFGHQETTSRNEATLTSAFQSQDTSNANNAISNITPTISEELLPPLEPEKQPNTYSTYQDDYDFSFLVPPPARDDNTYFQKNTFESLKSDSTQFPKTTPAPPSSEKTFENFQDDASNIDSQKSFESVSFSPRTKMIFGMTKARSLGRESSSFDFPIVVKPVNFLEPPHFKSFDMPGFGRSNFNFRNDDYPYVETLRSIQNNKDFPSSVLSSASTRLTTSATTISPKTEASIFSVPLKPLSSAGEIENDPYYPRIPTSTEAYYTPRHQSDRLNKPFFTTTRRPFTSSKFEIPAVLPDLNSLEDLLDRRKFFFIPQIKSV